MTLSLFVLIAWLTIIAFFLIPKSLTAEENIIMFFILNITIISINTILSLNLNLIKSSPKLDAFISSSIQRTTIIPICYLILLNLLFFCEKKAKKIAISILMILILSSIELLALWTGFKTYTGWNFFLTISTLSVLTLIYFFLAKFVKKIP